MIAPPTAMNQPGRHLLNTTADINGTRHPRDKKQKNKLKTHQVIGWNHPWSSRSVYQTATARNCKLQCTIHVIYHHHLLLTSTPFHTSRYLLAQTMPPIPKKFDQETAGLIESIERRRNDIDTLQLPRLEKCAGPLSLQQQYASELRDDIEILTKQIDVSAQMDCT